MANTGGQARLGGGGAVRRGKNVQVLLVSFGSSGVQKPSLGAKQGYNCIKARAESRAAFHACN